MFFRETSLFAAVSRIGIATLLCLGLLVPAGPAAAEGISISAKGIGLVLFGVTLFEIGNALSPINEWKTKIRELSQDEEFLKSRMAVEMDPSVIKEYQERLDKVRDTKREKSKKLTRFKSWFYPAVGVAMGGLIVVATWLNGGPPSN